MTVNHLTNVALEHLSRAENPYFLDSDDTQIKKAMVYALLAIAEEMHEFNEMQREFQNSLSLNTTKSE